MRCTRAETGGAGVARLSSALLGIGITGASEEAGGEEAGTEIETFRLITDVEDAGAAGSAESTADEAACLGGSGAEGGLGGCTAWTETGIVETVHSRIRVLIGQYATNPVSICKH